MRHHTHHLLMLGVGVALFGTCTVVAVGRRDWLLAAVFALSVVLLAGALSWVCAWQATLPVAPPPPLAAGDGEVPVVMTTTTTT